jgi:DNA invertase Pin-like site-specific DNA recombinase
MTEAAMAMIGYARVSTQDQNLSLQLDALQAVGCKRIFEDRASGAKANRPGLAAAIAYVRDEDVLVVWKLDRLGRSLTHLIETVTTLESRGVGLAQFERDLIRERTRAGMAAAAARGRRGGRKPTMTEEKLRRARALLGSGLSIREIAARIKVGKTSLYAALTPGDLEEASKHELRNSRRHQYGDSV